MHYALAIAAHHRDLAFSRHHLLTLLRLHRRHVVVATLAVMHCHAVRAALARLASAAAALFRRKPKVSVITPTWRRAGALTGRCVPSVRAQTYDGPVEHIVVSDGPDPALAGLPGIRFLPRHVPELNRGLSARRHGISLATGDILAYLDDDNAWRPRHLEFLVAALLETGADFAYSRALCHADPLTWTIGQNPPAFGQVDTSLLVHWRGALEAADWAPSRAPADWALVHRWQRAALRWVFVPRVTLDYYVRADRSVPG